LDDRLQIADLVLAGVGVRAIATQIGRAPSTVSRELRRNGHEPCERARGKYAPHAAQKRTELRARRPKVSKFDDPELASLVQAKLCLKWSPEQISDHLAAALPDRQEMQVSPETIYQALYVQGRGHLRADLHQHLRTGRAAAIKTLPAHLRKTLTWDQGTELAQHRQITTATKMAIYFCDPHSPWQRGSNENGLLRQYFPKGTDLSVHSPERLLEVATELNDRPRKTLGGITPAQARQRLLFDPESPVVATTA